MEARARERRRRRRTLLTTALALAIIAVAAVADGARAPARPHAIREEEHQPQRPEDGEEEPQVDTVHVVFSNHLVSVRESGARVLLVADESEWCRWTHPLSRSLPRAAPSSSPPTHTPAPKKQDMGFTDQDDKVIEQYFYEHFPRAVRCGPKRRRRRRANAHADVCR